MLVTFKSKAAADVPMYLENAKALLDILGKPLEPAANPKGIITAEDVPAALAKLKAAADASKADQKATGTLEDDKGQPLSVGLAQRACPLIDMLERAAKDRREVVWGV